MSAKVKEALFELIKSLSKSEKRYFKLMASRHTIGDENNYVVLFDFIEKQEIYDEEAIFKNFKGEAFLHRFSITKKRLYDHVLQSLDAFHSVGSIEAQLYRQLHAAEILYDKSLYEQARRILKSAEKLAIKHEEFILLQKINRLNKKLIENDAYSDATFDVIGEIREKDMFYVDQSSHFNQLWQIKSELFTIMRTKGISRTEEDRNAFSNLIEKLPSYNQLEGFENRYLYNHIKSAYFFAIQQPSDCAYWLEQNLNLFSLNEMQIENQLNTYVSLLTNAIYIHESLGNRTNANNLLTILRKVPKERETVISEDMAIKLFASINSVELGILMKRGDLDLALKLIPVIEQGMRVYDGKITSARRAFLSFKLATIHLGLKNYSEALKWVNRILNDPDLDPAEDLLAFTHLIDLLIHLELKHDQLLPYALKNTQRFLRSRNKMHEFEKVFLQFISKLIKCNNPFDAEILWEELLQDFDELNGSGLEKIALEFFDFKAWAESKVKKKDFSRILKEKIGQELNKAS